MSIAGNNEFVSVSELEVNSLIKQHKIVRYIKI